MLKYNLAFKLDKNKNKELQSSKVKTAQQLVTITSIVYINVKTGLF